MSRRGNISVDGKMRQKGFNLFGAHLLGVAFVVIKDKTTDSFGVCLLSPNTIVFNSDYISNTNQQTEFTFLSHDAFPYIL